MKKILFLVFLLSVLSFSQSVSFIDSLTASDTTYHNAARSSEFLVLTITLPSANDTVVVYTGTNLDDSTIAQQEYGQTVVTDMYSGSEVPVITGNTTTNRKYFIKWGHKQKNFALVSLTNSATLHYVLEAY